MAFRQWLLASLAAAVFLVHYGYAFSLSPPGGQNITWTWTKGRNSFNGWSGGGTNSAQTRQTNWASGSGDPSGLLPVSSEVHQIVKDPSVANRYWYAMTSGIGWIDGFNATTGNAMWFIDWQTDTGHEGHCRFVSIVFDVTRNRGIACSATCESVIAWNLDSSLLSQTPKMMINNDNNSYKFTSCYYQDQANSGGSNGGREGYLYLTTGTWTTEPSDDSYDMTSFTGGGNAWRLAVDANDLDSTQAHLPTSFSFCSSLPSSLFTYAVTADSTYSYSVGNLGRVLTHQLSSSSSCTSSTVGIPNALYTSVIATGLQKIVVGTFGLYCEINMNTKSIIRLFFLDNFPQITAVTMDTVNQVLFFGTTGSSVPGGYVYRVNYVDFFPYEDYIGPLGENIKTVFFETQNNVPYIYTSPRTTNTSLYIINVAECPTYGCDECLSYDTNYCSICSTSYTCQISATCSGTSYAAGNYTCPGVNGFSPTFGSKDGGTLVTLTGFGFTTGLYCRFGTSVVVATFIDSTTLHCTAPAQPSVTSDTGFQLDIVRNISGSITLFVSGDTYTYYDCNQFSNCSANSCYSRSECRWCLNTASCANGLSCNASSTTVCPTVSSYTPQAVVFQGPNRYVDIDLSAYPTSATFTCDFNGTQTNGSIVSNNLRCPVPDSTPTGFYQLTPMIGSNAYSLPVTVEFFDCQTTIACSSCLSSDRASACQWCDQSLSCVYANDTVCSSLTGTCPGILNYTPTAWNMDNTAYPAINLTVSSFQNVSLSCKFILSNGTLITTTATFYNSSYMSCAFPLGAPTGLTQFQVYTNAFPYSELEPITLYRCTELDACTDCLVFADCGYCNQGGMSGCRLGSQMSNCTGSAIASSAVCPVTDGLSPASALIDTVVNVTVSGVLFGLTPDESNLYCSWGALGQFQAISNNVTTVTCETPLVASATSVNFTLVRDGKAFGGMVSFDFYSCNQFSNSCASCVNPAYNCGWCLDHCSSEDDCTSTLLNVCPAISSITPNIVVRQGVQRVTLLGGPFQNVPYQCAFGSFVTDGVYLNDTAIRCDTPVVPAFATGIYTVSTNVSLLYNGNPYSQDVIDLTFYDCTQPSLTTCDIACFAPLPQCGWCIDGGLGFGQCTASVLCDNFFASNSCIAISSVSPDHTIPSGNETITLTLDRLLPFVDNDTVQCSFAGTNVSATVGQTSDAAPVSQVTCVAPAHSARKRAVATTVEIFRNDLSVTTAPNAFTYVDCTLIPQAGEFADDVIENEPHSSICTRCVVLPFCGFCAITGDCQVHNWCLDPTFWYKNATAEDSCPTLDRVRPQTGQMSGGDTVTISGSRFINSSEIRLAFAALNDNSATAYANVTFISDTELQASTPTFTVSGDVSVFVMFNNTFYSTDSGGFTYLQQEPQTISGGAIGGIVAGCAAAFGGLGALLIVLKRRKVGVFSIELKEPDYLEIAFGSDRTPQFKIPEDNYQMLTTALMEKDRTFLFTFSRSVQPTEHDKVSKSYVEMTHRHDRAKEFIIAFISEEVFREKSENTIFRSNSVTSKMFKFYAKLIATRFLWSKTARIIVELNTIAAEKMKQISNERKRGTSGGSSLFTMEMEVDPTKITDDGENTTNDTDQEANVLQLLLTCQKVWGTLMRSLKDMPVEFREIFANCQFAIISRFQSQEAVFKSVGGFLFLRFVCPALTAPHAYGLLENPPNEVCQRQLVLIGKVLQNLANMTRPGAKEEFMQKLDSFFEKNIPKMEQFYRDILIPPPIGSTTPDLPVLPADVTDVVYGNAMSNIWSVIFQSKKVTAQIDKEYSDNPEVHTKLHNLVKELHEKYPRAPKKLQVDDGKKKNKKDGKPKKRILGPRDDD